MNSSSTSVMFSALGGGDRLEAVVEIDGNVQVHSFHFLFGSLSD